MKRKIAKRKFNIYVLIYGLAIFIICAMTLGFAAYTRILNVNGSLSIPKMGRLVISDVSFITGSNVDANYNPIYTDDSIDFNTHFTSNSDPNADYFATYVVEFTNEGTIEYSLDSFSFSSIELVSTVPSDTADIDYEITGTVSEGYIFAPGETATATVKLFIIDATPGATYTTDGEVTAEVEIDKVYSLEAGISGTKTGNLTAASGNTRVPFTLDVISTYESNLSFTISLNSDNYKVVDSNGNALGAQTIQANSQGSYTFYIEIVDPTKITTNSQTLGVILTASGNAKIVDYVTLTVDQHAPDTAAPLISGLTFNQSTTYTDRGKGYLTWIGRDDSNITSYTIIMYEKASNASSYTQTTITGVTTTTNYPLTNLQEDATYYFKVYGTDQHTNTATSTEINNASSSTSGTPCMATDPVKCEWVFNVTTHLTYVTSDGGSTVNIGDTYSCRFTRQSSSYTMPSSITVKINNVTQNSSRYTYSRYSNAAYDFSISNVTGPLDITVTATSNGGGCLVEGTKVRLYDGICKNIEDIGYTDLLAVWSYDTGKVVPDYPIWIEKEHSSLKYKLIKFEDGTELKFVGNHAFFDINLNMCISLEDKEFGVGTEVVKIDDNGNVYTTKVASIEEVYETVNYYHIMSTKYFNIIANDFLTTDDTTIISNIFGFKDEGIIWPESRYEIIANEDNLFKYEDYKEIMPYHLFIGCRALEAKVICDQGFMTLKDFENYLYGIVVNPDMYLEPIKNVYGDNMWMMTTSLDDLSNKFEYLHKEGSIYTLPKAEAKDGKTAYWYNAVTNAYYECGEKIKVEYSMHFELIYK